MRTHVWQYFTVHAGQRMSMLNLFMLLTGLIAAGLGACVQGQGTLRLLGGILGVFLALTAFLVLETRCADGLSRQTRRRGDGTPRGSISMTA